MSEQKSKIQIRAINQLKYDSPLSKMNLNPEVKVRFKKIQTHASMPTQATAGSANFDFTCTRIEKRTENKYTLFFGIAVEVPEGYKMVIVPRSSITGTDAIQQNSPGQVDSDYRGELQMRITTLPIGINTPIMTGPSGTPLLYADCPYRVGDRVAQGFLERVIPVEFEEVEELSATERGEGGFGSTGTK